jgi:hypothetical protein
MFLRGWRGARGNVEGPVEVGGLPQVGSVTFAPDYQSSRPLSPLGLFTLHERDPHEEAVQTIANMIRGLRPGQTLTVEVGDPDDPNPFRRMFNVTVTDVTSDPA